MTWSDLEAERHERHERDELNAALGRALRAMPPAHAPRTLAPRVMAAVHARLAAPVDQTWFTWPVWAQLASVIGFVALVASVAFVWPSVEAIAARATSLEAVRVTSVFFRSIWQPIASWLVMGMTITALLCATLGALLTRVALGGASR